MPKTNAQIQQDFSKMPALKQLGVAALDLASIAGNSLSFGGANKLAQAVTGASDEQLADYERAQRVRAGLAGDVVNVAGMVRGGGLALGGAKKAVDVARALPTAVALVPTAGLGTAARYAAGTAGKGLVPAAAKVTKAGAAKAAGVLGLLGLSAAGRQDDTVASAPATPAQAIKSAMDQGRKSQMRELTPQERTLAALDTILRQPFSIDDLSTVAGALPGVAGAASKVSQKDMLYGKASSVTDELYKANLAAASKLTDQAARDKAILDITENYRRNLLGALNVDPSKEALAEVINQQRNGE